MYLIREPDSEFQRLNNRAKKLVAEVIAGVTPKRKGVKLLADREVYADPAHNRSIFHLVEGALACSSRGRIVYYFDTGDLVGLDQVLAGSGSKITSDFAVVVDEFDADQLLASVQSTPEKIAAWSELLSVRAALLEGLVSESSKDDFGAAPEIRAFRSGETIISENTNADEVYTLVEGGADVFVKGVKVGEVLVGEIFGVLAALSDIPRTASVVARDNSMVLVLPKENFSQLLESHPETVTKMVIDLVRTLIALNEKVVSLSLSKF